MQPEQKHLAMIRRIARKEVSLFFASPIAYLFLATFAGISLFVFFWGESYFSRNIADVRPLFEWMPVLLIFLTSTLTMRLWSEERRTGTLEHVLTQPLPLWHFVLGKFLGCLLLLAIALLITLPLPITIAQIGELDWGPVWAGYLAAFLLGAAYLSIGLFVSARSDNQIISLICAVGLCGAFYLVGSQTITDFFGNITGDWLRSLGTGSRFDSITRGVIDVRDLYYYLSIIIAFLTLNTFFLEKERWATQKRTPNHQSWRAVTALLLTNAVCANLWLGQVNLLRIDTTEGKQYSISTATQSYLGQLQEPLLIRGYFSSKSHPLLAPLVPQMKDLIREYEIAGHGKVRVEFLDPVSNPDLEEEANKKYGIRPTPLQVADRYQSAIVNSYFNILVNYGNEFQVLGFQDLIEVKSQGDNSLEIQLRNPEYDLTRSIKKVLNSYRGGGNLFDIVEGTLTLNAFISQNQRLPQQLVDYRQGVEDALQQLQKESGGRLKVQFFDPEANNGAVARMIGKQYGFQPMASSMMSDDHFYFYMTLEQDGQVIQLPIDDASKESFERNLKTGIKRFASGVTKTVAFVTPKVDPKLEQYGITVPRFSVLDDALSADLNVVDEDLSDGSVSADADILLIAAPNNLGDKELFAIDQFLMKGGTVVASASPFTTTLTQQGLGLAKLEGTFQDWLSFHGLNVAEKLVLDTQNASFPMPVVRDVGGYKMQEIRMIDYPYFVDVRDSGLNREHPISSSIPQVTMAWASPINIDTEKQGNRKITELVHSSSNSWASDDMEIMPTIDANGMASFPAPQEQGAQLLGVISEGRFTSYFAGKESPLLASSDSENPENDSASGENTDSAAQDEGKTGEEANKPTISSVIEHSPESARIILYSSNDFLRDQTMTMANSAAGSEYLNPIQMMANTVDWGLEDSSLLSIRVRGHFNRTLPPMEHDSQVFWEYLNYALAVIAIGIIALLQRRRKKSRQQHYLQVLAN
ncbi:MAG: Gldg family protein [Porticoccaceae bacterium]